MIKVHAISGIDTVGASMLAYEIGEDIIICDLGIDEFKASSVKGLKNDQLIEEGILPDYKELLKKKKNVRAIVLSNADANHIGAVEYIAKEFDCPVYGTSYTIEVLKSTQKLGDFEKRVRAIKQNIPFRLLDTKELAIELINTTYSVPQSSMIAIHSPNDGIIIHASAFKFDNRPSLGYRPNYKKLGIFSEKGVSLLTVDSLRSNSALKTMSEILIKEMLRDTFIETNIVDTKGIIVTTQASHMTRVKSIIDLSQETKREVLILGDFEAYITAAKKTGVMDFNPRGVTITSDEKKITELLEVAGKAKDKYVIICEGDQGEPNKLLSLIANGKTAYKIDKEDKVVFSSNTIPNPVCIENRAELDKQLDKIRCKAFKDMHVSGHASRSDIKDLIQMVKPKVILPVQGDIRTKEGAIEVAEELEYNEGSTLLIGMNKTIYDVE